MCVCLHVWADGGLCLDFFSFFFFLVNAKESAFKKYISGRIPVFLHISSLASTNLGGDIWEQF